MSPQPLSRLDELRQEDAAQKKADQLKLDYIDLKTAPLNIEAIRIIPEIRARAIKTMIFDKKAHEFHVVTTDPAIPETKDLLKEIAKFGTVKVFIASPIGIERFLDNYQFVPKKRQEIVGSVTVSDKYVQTAKDASDPTQLLESYFTTDFDTSEMIIWIFAYALASDASDLHVEPKQDKTLLRYRIDGVLYEIATLPPDLSRKITDRIKLTSRISLNIKNIPQDGRFSIKRDAYDMEVRVSTIPGPEGENVVMRFLNPNTIGLQLADLGFRDQDREIVEREIKKPNGLILETGPTGSGKTTTLYACLKHVASSENKVITLEDPIEYRIPGIEQTQTDAKSGYTFAGGLRAILRQDPDVILVGEIRDQETAEIAMHASLTGHLVFSTLHTNDASGTIPRLLDFKIKPEIIASALNLIVAQRLVRKLCQHCAETVSVEPKLLARMRDILNLDAAQTPELPELLKTTTMKTAKGCERCSGKGYKGRIGVFELIRVNEQMQELIHTNPDELKIKELARANGTVTLQAEGVMKILLGMTDLLEVEKMVGPIL